MRSLAFAFLIAIAGCAPDRPPAPMCDYCSKPREDARPYACRQCGKAHSSCRIEAPLHVIDINKEKGSLTAGRSVKVCPTTK